MVQDAEELKEKLRHMNESDGQPLNKTRSAHHKNWKISKKDEY